MKLIIGIIQPNKLEEIKAALTDVEVYEISEELRDCAHD